MPGHHGLEFMALIMAGRVASRIPWASSVSSLGIGLILLFPAFGFKDPFMSLNYMLPGFMIDICYTFIRRFRWYLPALALLSGVAYAMIPVSRLMIHLVSGYPYSAFMKHGIPFTVGGFFIFGMAGGFLGSGITYSILQKLRKKQQ
jgi:hypothetical protein